MKSKSIYWGLFCIALAVVIAITQLGILVDIGWLSIAATLLMLPLIIKSIIRREFFGVFIPLALIAMLFSKQLGIENISNWALIGIAVLLIIGFSFIFPGRKGQHNGEKHGFLNKSIKTETSNDEEVFLYSKFGASVKYINSNNLRHVNIDSSFSGVKVYLDGATLSSDGVIIDVWSDFSGIELYVPKECQIENKVDCFLSGIDEEGIKNYSTTGPIIKLNGKISFSGITIKYV